MKLNIKSKILIYTFLTLVFVFTLLYVLLYLNIFSDSNIISVKFNIRFLIISLLIIIFSLSITWFIISSYFKRLKKTSSVLEAMAIGFVSKIKNLNTNKDDEISKINKSINTINFNLDKTSQFIKEISAGNFDFEYKALTSDDSIGNSLVKMKQSFLEAKEIEKKRKENDERQNWATIGNAKFSEIIREHSDNIEELAYEIISDLVNYIGANQGGLFIINEDEKGGKIIELTASYAYGRRKMLEKKIPWGTGLVGRCILEKETIFMTKIPQNYLKITSGLGEERPATLLIVPLIFHEKVYGVVELASFKEIDKYKIDFTEQISESIASAISMVKINVRTAELLRETKIKSEQTASQEEEIRQNIEEMQSATDELNIENLNISNKLNALNSVAYTAVFNKNGRIKDISPGFLKLLKKEKEDIINNFQGSFSSEPQNEEAFKNFWRQLRRGKTMESLQVIKIGDELIKLFSTYIPIENSDGKIDEVVSFAIKQ